MKTLANLFQGNDKGGRSTTTASSSPVEIEDETSDVTMDDARHDDATAANGSRNRGSPPAPPLLPNDGNGIMYPHGTMHGFGGTSAIERRRRPSLPSNSLASPSCRGGRRRLPSLRLRRGGGGGGDDNDAASTTSTLASSSSRRSILPPSFRLRRVASPESRIAEARGRVAAMLAPPPFAEGEASRLAELREAKSRAMKTTAAAAKTTTTTTTSPPRNLGGGGGVRAAGDDGGVGRGRRGGGLSAVDECSAETRFFGSCDRSSSGIESSNSGTSIGLVAEARMRITTATTRTKEEGGRRVLVRVAVLLLLAAARPPSVFPLPLVLMILQTASLRHLLCSALVYSFESFDLGQVNLARNMERGRRMFASEVRRYTGWVSSAVALGSCAVAYAIPSLSSGGGSGEGGGGRWDVRACEVSAYVSSRLGVFVVSFLLLCRASFFAPPSSRHRGGRAVAGEGPSIPPR